MASSMVVDTPREEKSVGLSTYYNSKIDEMELKLRDKAVDLQRLEAQRNELNGKGAPPPPLARPLRRPLPTAPPPARPRYCGDAPLSLHGAGLHARATGRATPPACR